MKLGNYFDKLVGFLLPPLHTLSVMDSGADGELSFESLCEYLGSQGTVHQFQISAGNQNAY